ncbi:M23 family metallopeptidase [Allosalinactinospora lopnorensis]|uniref:M23 family metallopeptidase n=1 Tax=Allosalinactinospora lopnorensis TaxID=1352348 RepID=UPI0009E4E091|nr:M23 family metallopeptidase [Allosalinactinospora lopnorensis]
MGTALLRHRPRTLLALLVLVPTVLAGPAPAPADDGPWRRPLSGEPEVIREFAPPAQRWLPGHRGVDLAAEPGDTVLAPAPGRVAFAGNVAGTAAVSIRHGELRTTYVPVRAEIARGTEIGAGDPIGTVAAAPRHCGARSCLHWGLLRDRTYLDPLSLLGAGEVRLLPVRGRGAARPRSSGAGMGAVVGLGEAVDRDVRVDLGAPQR